MSREGKEIIERLGRDGLGRVFDDILDHRRLVRLANACGLKYPGMRTQSQKRERLIADLVERGRSDEAAQLAICRALEKETRAAGHRWGQLSAEDKAERLGNDRFLRSNGNLGVHLYLLAAADGEAELHAFESLLARKPLLRVEAEGAAVKDDKPKPSREEARLRKRNAELLKKSQHLEAQLAKSRETERTFKKDLIQRKGELAESRMLAERLRRESEAARQAAAKSAGAKPSEAAPADSAEKLARAVRRLAAEQKKLAHRLERLPDPAAARKPSEAPKPDPKVLAPLLQEIADLRKELAAQRRELKKEARKQAQHVEQLLSVLDSGRAAAAAAQAARDRDGRERVGVFIDVQNMYYGARQLKGKLDFDALRAAAVRDRRLIQATAYVVESKEIDQSGFIAVLEKLAIEVRRKTLQVRADGSMKGDWDMELALDILNAAPRLDVVVLVSGDGDFTSLVKRVKEMGPRVEVIGFPRTTAKSLLEAADDFKPLDRKFMIYPRGSQKKRSGRSSPLAAPVQPAKSHDSKESAAS